MLWPVEAEDRLEEHWAWAVDAGVLLCIAVFLVLQFPPSLMFSGTTPTGGDTASHYPTLVHLKEKLLPLGRISGWSQGNYAGFPILEFYFPLPFLIMAGLSFVTGLPAAFKLGTVLGTFLLPPAAYLGLKKMRFGFPAPILGAVGTLPFLFMEANSMWGGNIPSTLAGEFTYSLGLALTLLWMGLLDEGIRDGRSLVRNAAVLATIGFSHGYTLLFAGALSLFYLLERKTAAARLGYLLQMHGLAFLLMSFWLTPLLSHLPWTTSYNFTWHFANWKEVLPKILLPLVPFAACALALERTRQTACLAWGAFLGGVFFVLAPTLGVVDIRFLPFSQLYLGLLAAAGLGALLRRVRGRALVPPMALIAALWWVDSNVRFIPYWVQWNYGGYESKRMWPVFSKVNTFLKGTVEDPRVVFEHSDQHNAIGTTRAWESLPLFSGRSTLEHVYMQASPSAPFVFYIQSEVSKQISCPFPQYACTRLDLRRARDHLELFNVRDLVVLSDKVKSALRHIPGYRLRFSEPPYAVYALEGPHRYVTPLTYEPVLWTGGDWKEASFAWFRRIPTEKAHLVFPLGSSGEHLIEKRFPHRTDDLSRIPEVPIRGARPVLREKVSDHEVSFETDPMGIGRPHLVKVSYHPNWRVEGADRIYLISPSFMLVYPERSEVRLYYGRSPPEAAGILLTLAALAAAVWLARFRKGRPLGLPGLARGPVSRPVWSGVRVLLSAALLGTLGLSLHKRFNAPHVLLTRGFRHKDAKQWRPAEKLFRRVVKESPLSGSADQAQYNLGLVGYLQERWEDGAREFEELLERYPDSRWAGESVYHLGLCYERLGRKAELGRIRAVLQRDFRDTPWARYARERWPR